MEAIKWFSAELTEEAGEGLWWTLPVAVPTATVRGAWDSGPPLPSSIRPESPSVTWRVSPDGIRTTSTRIAAAPCLPVRAAGSGSPTPGTCPAGPGRTTAALGMAMGTTTMSSWSTPRDAPWLGATETVRTAAGKGGRVRVSHPSSREGRAKAGQGGGVIPIAPPSTPSLWVRPSLPRTTLTSPRPSLITSWPRCNCALSPRPIGFASARLSP
mmetsp:Transcript_21028/g.61154  ORF Transcript_21028/g.61154 Transcript_21028/m.61154 type:complete len:213 (-) Transcript_21028:669-1307(-)